MINCVPFASHLLGMAGSCINNIASNWLATAKNNKSPYPCPKRLLVGWQGQGGQLKRTGPRVGWLVGGRGGGPSIGWAQITPLGDQRLGFPILGGRACALPGPPFTWGGCAPPCPP